MALQLAYTLFDLKALTYSPPFFTSNDALAKRMLSEIVTDTNTTVGRHPSDYKLYKVGMFDDQTGIFDRLSIMEHICDAVSLLPPPRPDMFEKYQQMMGEKPIPMTNGEAK